MALFVPKRNSSQIQPAYLIEMLAGGGSTVGYDLCNHWRSPQVPFELSPTSRQIAGHQSLHHKGLWHFHLRIHEEALLSTTCIASASVYLAEWMHSEKKTPIDFRYLTSHFIMYRIKNIWHHASEQGITCAIAAGNSTNQPDSLYPPHRAVS